MPYRFRLTIALIVCAGAGCSMNPQRANPSAAYREVPLAAIAPPARAAATAVGLVGTPYRYGGTGPDGFDCSGLVYYAFGQAGVRVPRTSLELLRATRSVPLDAAGPGDLLFFRFRDKVSHVGIYLGNREFVHAPSHGGAVEVESLENPYYERHLLRAGRLDL